MPKFNKRGGLVVSPGDPPPQPLSLPAESRLGMIYVILLRDPFAIDHAYIESQSCLKGRGDGNAPPHQPSLHLPLTAALFSRKKALVIVAQTVSNGELPPKRRVEFRVPQCIEQRVRTCTAAACRQQRGVTSALWCFRSIFFNGRR